MENVKELLGKCREKIKSHPKHREEIAEIFQLAVGEIEQGGSMQHEAELCMESIEQLINADN